MATGKVAPMSLAKCGSGCRGRTVSQIQLKTPGSFLSSNSPCPGIFLCRSCIRYHRSEQTVQKHQDSHSQIGHVMSSHLNCPGTHMNCRKRMQVMCVRYMITTCKVSNLVRGRQILQTVKHSPRICVSARKEMTMLARIRTWMWCWAWPFDLSQSRSLWISRLCICR